MCAEISAQNGLVAKKWYFLDLNNFLTQRFEIRTCQLIFFSPVQHFSRVKNATQWFGCTKKREKNMSEIFFKVWASLFRQTRLPPSPPPRRVGGGEIHSRPFFRFISFPKVGVMCYRGTKVAEQFRFLPFSFVASFHPHPPLPVRPPLCCLPPPVTSCLLASRPTTNFAWNWKIESDWKKNLIFVAEQETNLVDDGGLLQTCGSMNRVH